MLTRHKKDKSEYLRAGILCFIAWTLAAYFMINEVRGKDGIIHIIRSVKEGDYLPMFLVALSVILLAFTIKNIAFYFKPEISDKKYPT